MGSIFDEIPDQSTPEAKPSLGLLPNGQTEQLPLATSGVIPDSSSIFDQIPDQPVNGGNPDFKLSLPPSNPTLGDAMDAFWAKNPNLATMASGVRSVAPPLAAGGLGALTGAVLALPTGESAAPITIPVATAAGLGAAGAYGLGSTLFNGVSQGIINPAFGTNIPPAPPLREATDWIADILHIPKQATDPASKRMDAFASGASDTITGGWGLGKLLSSAAAPLTTTGRVAGVLQEAPLLSAAGGGLGGVGSELIDEALPPESTDDPWRRSSIEIIKQGLGLLSGHVPGIVASGAHGAVGSRELPQNFKDALRESYLSRPGANPKDADRYMGDIQASSPLSAAARGFLSLRPFDAFKNNSGFNAALKNVGNSPINRQQVLDAGFGVMDDRGEIGFPNQAPELPGYTQTSIEASGDTGVASALKESVGEPRVQDAILKNQQSIARAKTLPLTEGFVMGGSPPSGEETPLTTGEAYPHQYALEGVAQGAKEAHIQKEALSAKDAQDNLAANEAAKEQANSQLEGQKAAFDGMDNSEFRRNVSSAIRSLIDAKDAGMKAQYLKLLDAVQSGAPVKDISGLPEAINRIVSNSLRTGGAPLHPDIIRLFDQFQSNHGISAPDTSSPAAGARETIIPSSAVGAPTGLPSGENVSANMAKIAADKLAALPEAKPGQVRKLNPGENEVETTTTPGGSDIQVKRELVPLSELIRADTPGDERHPGVEGGYQNRNRKTAESDVQVQKILSGFKPDLLSGNNPSAPLGAPIVDGKNVVEGGHARLLALEKIFNDPKYASQKQQYIDALKVKGYDVTGIDKAPMVEVQRRQTPLTTEQTINFVRDLNESHVAGMSSVERAAAEGAKINLEGLKSNDLAAPENRDFLRQFVQDNNLSGSGLTVNGEPTPELLGRAKNALRKKAYSSDGSSANVIDNLITSPDSEIKSIGKALDAAAPEFAKLRDQVEAGNIDPRYDLGKKVAEAVSMVEQHRSGNTPHPMDVVAQGDMIKPVDPLVADIVKTLYSGGNGRQIGAGKLTEVLKNIASGASEQTKGMFAGMEVPPEKIVKTALEKASTAEPLTKDQVAAQEQLSKLESTEGGAGSEQAKKLRAQLGESEPVMNMSVGSKKPQTEGAATPPAGTLDATTATEAPAKTGPEALKAAEGKPTTPMTIGDVASAQKRLFRIAESLKKNSDSNSFEQSQQANDLFAALKDIADKAPEGSDLRAAAEFYRDKYAPLYRVGDAKGHHESVNGVEKVSEESTAAKWLDKNSGTEKIRQFIDMGQGDPAHITNINDYLLSDMAGSMKGNATAEKVDRWIREREHILNQPELSATKSKLTDYMNSLRDAEGHLSDIKTKSSDLKKAASEADSNLSAKQSEAENLPIVKVANGKEVGADAVLGDVRLMRQAVQATKGSPEGRIGLENAIKDHLNRKFSTSEQVPGTAITGTPKLYDMFANSHVIEFLTHPNQIESMRALLGDDAVKQLQMASKAVTSERFREALLKGEAADNSGEKGIAQTAAQVLPSQLGFAVRGGLDLVQNRSGSKITAGKQIMADIVLSPKLLAEFVRATKIKDPKALNLALRSLVRGISKVSSVNNTDSNKDKTTPKDE